MLQSDLHLAQLKEFQAKFELALKNNAFEIKSATVSGVSVCFEDNESALGAIYSFWKETGSQLGAMISSSKDPIGRMKMELTDRMREDRTYLRGTTCKFVDNNDRKELSVVAREWLVIKGLGTAEQLKLKVDNN
jgi:hypothetical protein